MKIHEIISEDRIANEGLKKWALGKIANTVARSGVFKPNQAKAAYDELSAVWAKELHTTGKMITPAEDVVGKALAKDTKAVASAEKNAREAAAETKTAQNTQDLKNYASALGSNGMKRVNQLIKIGIVVAPIYHYVDRMEYCDAQLASGAWTQDEYTARKRQELSVMLGTMATSMVGWAGIKSFGAGSSWLLGWIPGFKPIMSLLTATGTAAATMWFNSDDGRYWIAQVFANDTFEGGKYDISPLIGGGAEVLINKFKSLIPGFNATPASPNKPTQADAGSKVSQDATSTTGNVASPVQSVQAGGPANTTTTGLQRTATGDIDFKESKQRHLRRLR